MWLIDSRGVKSLNVCNSRHESGTDSSFFSTSVVQSNINKFNSTVVLNVTGNLMKSFGQNFT